ncbi:hypothetical protein [Pendulispora albinea]|uniref:Uncharacterized protein n=1 Tax=Pendulispora albinea TaxID=2741071 RepID=A0ABZ2M296_9BACT
MKKRRAGATETFGISLDPETKQFLREEADRKYQGNVSALITELAKEAKRQAAFERAWKWYGGPEPTPEESAAIRAEWAEGWTLASKAKKSRRKKAA